MIYYRGLFFWIFLNVYLKEVRYIIKEGLQRLHIYNLVEIVKETKWFLMLGVVKMVLKYTAKCLRHLALMGASRSSESDGEIRK